MQTEKKAQLDLSCQMQAHTTTEWEFVSLPLRHIATYRTYRGPYKSFYVKDKCKSVVSSLKGNSAKETKEGTSVSRFLHPGLVDSIRDGNLWRKVVYIKSTIRLS
uniref:Ovule protein n=1 Tax=Heterorhabditis bacteriophora TaxID=37862 RepID=A0A1I7X7X2_HETBA